MFAKVFSKVSLNLDIQIQYLDFLKDFLDAEYKALQFGQFIDLFQLAKSIRYILKSLHKKRVELREETGVSLRDFLSETPQVVGDMLQDKLDRLSRLEEICMHKTDRNADLSLTLAGQEQDVLEHCRNGFFADNTVAGRIQ
jgi:flagellar biosynthesis/type III secretory pathway chaperone